MFKLAVLSILVAACAAHPSNLLGLGLGGHGFGLAAPLTVAAPAIAVPGAVSSSYRTDVINPVAAVVRTAPVAVAAPLTVAAPAVALGGHGLGLGALGLGGLTLGGLGHGW